MNIMDILNVPFGYVLEFCNKILPNYVLALLFFTLITKVLIFPLYIKQQKSQVKQAKLAPKEMAIRKKYAGRNDKPTQQKMQEEVMELYKQEGYNPVGGCLPLLLQFPIIISLYEVIRKPLTYICHIGGDVQGIKDQLVNLGHLILDNGKYLLASGGKTEITELDIIHIVQEHNLQGSIDSLKNISLPNFNLIGNHVDLSVIPSWTNWLWIIPILTFVFSFLSSKLIKKLSYVAPTQAETNNNGVMKVMEFGMPLISVFIAFSLPSVIGLYWIFQNIFMVLQQLVLKKMFPIPVFTEEDYKRAEKEYGGKNKDKKKDVAKVKSLHHIDDGETYVEPDTLPKKKIIEDDAPVLKDAGNGKLLKRKTAEKPPVRSLHHIDDEEVAAERAAAALEAIEKQKQAEKAKRERYNNN